MASHRNYDPGLIFVNFKGVNLSGFAAGTFINATRNEDSFSLEAGAGGDSVFIRNRNQTGTVTLTIMQGSPTNDYLASIIFNDELFGLGQGPLFLKDLNGQTLVEDQNARIQKPSDVSFGKDHEEREWVFLCPQMTIWTGGANT